MSSSIDIANQALLKLGARPIISFDDDSVEASSLKVLYGPAKGQVLRSFPWRCATKSKPLAQHVEPPVDVRWPYAFAWPKDAVRILEVTAADGAPVEWEVGGKQVLTEEKSVVAKYVFDVTEPNMDAHVELTLVAKLVADLTYTLTASSSRETAMIQKYDMELNEARNTDRQEASHRKFRIDTLDRVRR